MAEKTRILPDDAIVVPLRITTKSSGKGNPLLVEHLMQQVDRDFPIVKIPGIDEGLNLKQGHPCEVLLPRQQWRKGKVQLNIEVLFLPDQPTPEEKALQGSLTHQPPMS